MMLVIDGYDAPKLTRDLSWIASCANSKAGMNSIILSFSNKVVRWWERRSLQKSLPPRLCEHIVRIHQKGI